MSPQGAINPEQFPTPLCSSYHTSITCLSGISDSIMHVAKWWNKVPSAAAALYSLFLQVNKMCLNQDTSIDSRKPFKTRSPEWDWESSYLGVLLSSPPSSLDLGQHAIGELLIVKCYQPQNTHLVTPWVGICSHGSNLEVSFFLVWGVSVSSHHWLWAEKKLIEWRRGPNVWMPSTFPCWAKTTNGDCLTALDKTVFLRNVNKQRFSTWRLDSEELQ